MELINFLDMHIPVKIEHEGLYGLLGRLMHINGESNHLRGLGKLTARRPHSIVDFAIDASLKEHLSRVIDMSASMGNALLEAHLGGEVRNHSNLVSYSYGNVATRFWKTCPECMRSDVLRYGMETWHRAHQLPTTLVCAIHQVGLNVHNMAKRDLHDRFKMPFEAKSSYKTVQRVDSSHLYGLAKFANVAINDPSHPPGSEMVKQAFLAILIQRGYLRNGVIARNFYEDFEAYYGEGFLPLIRERMGITSPLTLLDGIINHAADYPLNRLLLVYWWFNGWAHFKSWCVWQNQFFYVDRLEGESTERSDLIHENRRKCIEMVASSNGLDRNQLLQKNYRLFRWLRNNDRQWLDRYLPITGRDRQLKLL